MRLDANTKLITIVLLMIMLTFGRSDDGRYSKHHRKRRHSDYLEEDNEDEDDVDYSDSSMVPPIAWQNPEHPERRQGRYVDDDHTEFVRTEYVDQVYKKIRTYNEHINMTRLIEILIVILVKAGISSEERFGTSGMPRQVECYSCMSLSYQTSWKYLQSIYIYPKVFTDRCRDPSSERGMPTVMCSSVCVSLMEPDIEAGVFIGFKHIRGCLDRVLRHGFNQSALRTHRFHQNNHCRTLSRASLFNPARATDPPAIGDVQLCSCYGDRCNSSSPHRSTIVLTALVAFVLLFH